MINFNVPEGREDLQVAYIQGAIAAVVCCRQSWREFVAFFKDTNIEERHYMPILIAHEAQSETFLFKDKRYKALINVEVEK